MIVSIVLDYSYILDDNTHLFEWVPASPGVIWVGRIFQFLQSITDEVIVRVLKPLLMGCFHWLTRDLL